MKPVLKVYRDICRGYSLGKSEGFPKIYHLTPFERQEVDETYDEFLSYSIKNLMPTKDECLKMAIEQGLWSEEKSRIIRDNRKDYENLKKSSRKNLSEESLKHVKETLQSYDEELKPLIDEQDLILSKSAEHYALWVAFQKEIQLSLKIDDCIDEYISEYSELKINDNDIREVCISQTFLDLFSVVEKDEFNFFGKAAVDLTENQLSLLRWGRRYFDISKVLEGKTTSLTTPDDWENAYIIKVNESKKATPENKSAIDLNRFPKR